MLVTNVAASIGCRVVSDVESCRMSRRDVELSYVERKKKFCGTCEEVHEVTNPY